MAPISLAYAHTFYNAILFMAFGSIIYATHDEVLARLGMLIRKLPFVAAVTLIGVMALCAMPFSSGFTGTYLIFEEALKLQGPIPGPILCLLLSLAMVLMILAGGLRLPYFTFWSKAISNRKALLPLPKNMGGGHGPGRGLLPGSGDFPRYC